MVDESRQEDERGRLEAEARDRLALTRVLIWAEHEAAALGRPDVAEVLREALGKLHARD